MSPETAMQMKQIVLMQAHTVPNELKLKMCEVVEQLVEGEGVEYAIGGQLRQRSVIAMSDIITQIQQDELKQAFSSLNMGIRVNFHFDKKRTADNISISVPIETAPQC